VFEAVETELIAASAVLAEEAVPMKAVDNPGETVVD